MVNPFSEPTQGLSPTYIPARLSIQLSHDRENRQDSENDSSKIVTGVTSFLNQPWFSIAELEADLKCQLHLPRPDRCHAGQHAKAGIPNCGSAATGRA